jgi:hypothetical protein
LIVEEGRDAGTLIHDRQSHHRDRRGSPKAVTLAERIVDCPSGVRFFQPLDERVGETIDKHSKDVGEREAGDHDSSRPVAQSRDVEPAGSEDA